MICRFRIQLRQYKIEIKNGARPAGRGRSSSASRAILSGTSGSRVIAARCYLDKTRTVASREKSDRDTDWRFPSSFFPLAHLARPQDYRASAPGSAANLIMVIRIPRGVAGRVECFEWKIVSSFMKLLSLVCDEKRLESRGLIARAIVSRANHSRDNSDDSCCAWIDSIVVAISIAHSHVMRVSPMCHWKREKDRLSIDKE